MSFLQNISPEWLEEEYLRWRESPESVAAEWQSFFAGFDLGRDGLSPLVDSPRCRQCSLKQSAVHALVHRYRDVGHLAACTDPLSPCSISHPLLDLSLFELGGEDLDTVFTLREFHKSPATLQEILTSMQETYCRSIGVEFMYIQEPGERRWLIDRMESVGNRSVVTREEQFRILAMVQRATLFEEFLDRRFPGQKRFSLEGGESLLVCLQKVMDLASSCGVGEVILGMSHRGRLNVLANIFGKPLANIFAEFEDNLLHGFVGEGDVKYHKGFSTDLAREGKNDLHLSLAFNPSHLEAIDPVVEGKCRALQDQREGAAIREVLPVLVHGDAAFSGQGVVAETLNLSGLEGYGTGGTLHIVLNNQIGFTTLPEDARSTRYATDVARMLMIPVFHVHGDDPEAVARVAQLAMEYRQEFGRDVVMEIICYRRHGHNEGDEPAFTQPLMYERIREREPLHVIYGRRLEEEGVSPDTIREMATEYGVRLDESLGRDAAPVDLGFSGVWQGVRRDYEPITVATAVPAQILSDLAEELARFPVGFTPHPKLATLYRKRYEAVQAGAGLDWGNCEALAFATLVREGVSVRLSGQDSRRGTFNHRHGVLHDTVNEATWCPLASLAGAKGRFRAFDSMLSEYGVLGFEYGYSVAMPEGLTIWEAQFGDFANGAQVIIDQFIASGESKWDRASGLVMLLPHGYEGNGAEHSSARIERFLSLCGENNLQVVYPSTSAQFFHLLRRQMKQPFRLPLVVFTPKSLLRHPAAAATLEELAKGGFREVIGDSSDPAKVKRVLLCCGKIFHELATERQSLDRVDVAIIRIEQLYPFREEILLEALAPLSAVKDVCWVQEEPANMGAWPFLRNRLTGIMGTELRYLGRPEAAAPATGSHRLHGEEQSRLIREAFAA